MKRRKVRTQTGPAEAAPPADPKTKLTEMLDIPAAALVGSTHIELSGNREAVIDGCKGVLAYDENMIRLAVHDMVVTFLGRNLEIKVLTHSSAIVGGFITNLEFST